MDNPGGRRENRSVSTPSSFTAGGTTLIDANAPLKPDAIIKTKKTKPISGIDDYSTCLSALLYCSRTCLSRQH